MGGDRHRGGLGVLRRRRYAGRSGIAGERAEFRFPEVLLGVPTIVGAIRLPQRINWHDAMELLLTGERTTPETPSKSSSSTTTTKPRPQ